MAFLQASRVAKALLCVALLYLELFVYRWWTADPDAAHAGSTYVKPRILAGGKEEFVRQRVIVGSSFGAHDGESPPFIIRSVTRASPGSSPPAPSLLPTAIDC